LRIEEDLAVTRSWTVRSVVVGLAVIGLGVVWLASGTPASAGDTASLRVATGMAASVFAGGEAKYVGSGKCKMCHKKVFDTWTETSHAKTLDMLRPGEWSEAKAKYGLDAGKDYTTDETCLGCHVVGYGKAGGFEHADDEKKAAKVTKNLGHVGCESCHGAGGGYMKLHKAIKKEKRTYKWSEMEAAGMVKITAETCTCCHNDTSPTYDESKKFDFEAMKEKGAHKMIGLKQREE
jgi:hypothetical protein